MRVLIAGDTHGNDQEISWLAALAGQRKISHLIIVGDFGLWGGLDGIKFLDHCQQVAEGNNLSIMAVLGNHENYDVYEAAQKVAPTGHGFTYVRSRVLVTKLSKFKMGGKVWGVAGGAVSIDKEWRLAKERGGRYNDRDFGYSEDVGHATGPRTLWWPQEQLTDEEVAIAEGYGKVDYLLTHDCSDFTPFNNRLKPDLDSQLHRLKIDGIIAATQPTLHFHGHMHERYVWENTQSHGFYSPDEPDAIVTKTYGLEADFSAQGRRNQPYMHDNWLVLDTDTDEVSYRGQSMNFRSLNPTD